MLTEQKNRGIIFIDSSCVRDDLLRVYQTLAEAFLDIGIQIDTLCGPGVEKSDIEKYSFPRTVFWTEVKSELKIGTFLRAFERNCWTTQFVSSLKQRAPLVTSIYLAMEAQRFSQYLTRISPAFILGIRFTSFTPAVFAADCLGIPLYAIQHSEYPRSDLGLLPDEWPAKNIFSFSEKSKREHENRFTSFGPRFISAGPIWEMRRRGKTPERKPGRLLVIESDKSIFSDSLIEKLKALSGKENFAIKPHPYWIKLGVSDAINRHSDFCDFSDFWDNLPEVALSLSSSATFELIHLGVPVISIYSESVESDYFPITGSFQDTTEGLSKVFSVVRSVLNHQTEREALLRKQREELSEMLAEASHSLKRIVSVIIAEAIKG